MTEPAMRRSTRLKAKIDVPAKLDPTYDPEEEEPEAEEEEVFQPRRKKAKTTRSKKKDHGSASPVAESSAKQRRKVGKLAMLPNMPLDVLYEIFRNLPPYELLRLARTTKSLRAVLLNRNARSVWIDALEAVPGLPACPVDMSEPAYTRLVFDTHCSFCSGIGAQGTLWIWRLRTCRKCLDDAANPYTDGLEGSTLFFTQITDYELYGLVSSIRIRDHFKSKSWGEMRYLRSEVEEVRAALEALKACSAEEKTAFMEERKARLTLLSQHARECQAWYVDAKHDRADELQQARVSRKQNIVANLRELGYRHELQFIEDDFGERIIFDKHPHVRVSRALTARAWAKIKDDMIAHMDRVRITRLAALRDAVFRRRIHLAQEPWRTHCQTRVFDGRPCPQFQDVCQVKAFRDVLDLPMPEAVSLDTVTKDSFNEAANLLPQLDMDWQTQCERRLASLLPLSFVDAMASEANHDQSAAVGDQDASTSKLDLAAAVFTCKRCYGDRGPVPCGASQIMEHRCSEYVYGRNNASLEDLVVETTGRRPWNWNNSIVIDDRSLKDIKCVLDICKKDIQTTTCDDLSHLDPRFICQVCEKRTPSGGLGREVMPWRNAVTHIRYSSHEHPSIARLDPAEEQRAKEIESLQDLLSACGSYNNDWGCSRCDEITNKSSIQIAVHLHEAHDVEIPKRPDMRYTSMREWKPPYTCVILPVEKVDGAPQRDSPAVE